MIIDQQKVSRCTVLLRIMEEEKKHLIKWGFGEPPPENQMWEGFSFKT
jgi:hypothetical protein